MSMGGDRMPNGYVAIDDALIRRFANFTRLSESEVGALGALTGGRSRTKPARQDLIREGDSPRTVFLLKGGWACRYKTLDDGRRQCLGFLIAGDLCDYQSHVLGHMDHSIGSITPVEYVEIGHDRIEQVVARYPLLARAFWWQALTSASAQREWAINLGQRSALERIAHLFCELFLRLQSIGMTSGNRCDMPITQMDIAEATGLTSVHVNRTLQEMRANGLIMLKERVLEIPDLSALLDSAMFSRGYLHLGRNRPPGARPVSLLEHGAQ